MGKNVTILMLWPIIKPFCAISTAAIMIGVSIQKIRLCSLLGKRFCAELLSVKVTL